MTHLFGVLSTGTSALLTQQRAINVTGNNIANVNTPGYSRQRIVLETATPVGTAAGLMSFGVVSRGIERFYDRFLGVQIQAEASRSGRWEAEQAALERTEAQLDENGGWGIAAALSGFFGSWQDLVLRPGGEVERTVAVAAAERLAETVRSRYAELERMRRDLDRDLESAVEQVNRLALQVSELNGRIARAELGGDTANDYRDRREQVLKELAGLIDIQTSEAADGQVSVSTSGGRPLVESGNTWTLRVAPGDDGHARIFWPDLDGALADITASVGGGRLGGLLAVRDGRLVAYQERIDEIARGLLTEANAVHAAGFGLEGTTGTDLFAGSGAADLRLNPEVAENPGRLAASATAAGVPGNADNALRMLSLRETPILRGGTATFEEAAQGLVSLVGFDVQQARAQAEHTSDMLGFLENHRESVSGVSLDEEMVNLIRYQAAYQAAAKLVSLADEMLDSLMTMVR
ncbi:MAG: flagellar hook-associated protein FlgK [Desulfobacterales bacterium]